MPCSTAPSAQVRQCAFRTLALMSLLDWKIAKDTLVFFRTVILHDTEPANRALAVNAVFDLVLVYGVRRTADAYWELSGNTTMAGRNRSQNSNTTDDDDDTNHAHDAQMSEHSADTDRGIKKWTNEFLRLQAHDANVSTSMQHNVAE